MKALVLAGILAALAASEAVRTRWIHLTCADMLHLTSIHRVIFILFRAYREQKDSGRFLGPRPPRPPRPLGPLRPPLRVQVRSSAFLNAQSADTEACSALTGLCLNGGRSLPALATGDHLFCLCADGFEGVRCEAGERPEPSGGHL